MRMVIKVASFVRDLNKINATFFDISENEENFEGQPLRLSNQNII